VAVLLLPVSGFTAVKEGIEPVPEDGSPIDVLLFAQRYCAPVPLNAIACTVEPGQASLLLTLMMLGMALTAITISLLVSVACVRQK
jgi:hypothetical protein